MRETAPCPIISLTTFWSSRVACADRVKCSNDRPDPIAMLWQCLAYETYDYLETPREQHMFLAVNPGRPLTFELA
jgi:hypothetical protein